MAEVLTWAKGLAWAGGLTWADVEGLDWVEVLALADVEGLDWVEDWAKFLVEVLIGVEVEGSTLFPKSSLGRVTISVTGMSGVVIGFFLVTLMPDLKGRVSDGAVGWDNGIKKSVANMASTDMLVIWGNRATMACISVAWRDSYLKIKWSNLFIQIKFNLYR